MSPGHNQLAPYDSHLLLLPLTTWNDPLRGATTAPDTNSGRSTVSTQQTQREWVNAQYLIQPAQERLVQYRRLRIARLGRISTTDPSAGHASRTRAPVGQHQLEERLLARRDPEPVRRADEIAAPPVLVVAPGGRRGPRPQRRQASTTNACPTYSLMGASPWLAPGRDDDRLCARSRTVDPSQFGSPRRGWRANGQGHGDRHGLARSERLDREHGLSVD